MVTYATEYVDRLITCGDFYAKMYRLEEIIVGLKFKEVNEMDKLKKDARLLLKCIDHWFNDILIDGDYSKSEGADCALCKEYRRRGCVGCPLVRGEFEGYNTLCCMEWINYRRGKNLPLAAKMIERLLTEYKTIINKLVSESEKKLEWEEVKITWRLEGGDMRGHCEFTESYLVRFAGVVKWNHAGQIRNDGTLWVGPNRFKIENGVVYRLVNNEQA